jgi:hypothetical protein
MLLEAEKNVLTDLFYSTLEILNILACSANFLVMYIGTVKICGKYLAVKSHFFEFARLTLWLTLAPSNFLKKATFTSISWVLKCIESTWEIRYNEKLCFYNQYICSVCTLYVYLLHNKSFLEFSYWAAK